MRAIWIAAVIVLGLLIATNPSRDDFNAWAQTYAKKKMQGPFANDEPQKGAKVVK